MMFIHFLSVSGLRSKDLQFYSWDEAAAGVAFPGRVHRRGSDPRHGTDTHAALGALLRAEIPRAGLHAAAASPRRLRPPLRDSRTVS